MHTFARALATDAEEVFAIHCETTQKVVANAYPAEIIEIWNKGRSAQSLAALIERNNFYVAREGEGIVGFVHFDDREIVGLYCRVGHTGKGLGREMFEFAVSEIQSRPIKILATLNAVGFYMHMGCRRKAHRIIRRNDHDIYVVELEYA